MLVAPRCPHCAAHLPPRDQAGRYTCDYCGLAFEAERSRPQEQVERRPVRSTGALAKVVGVMALGSMGLAIYLGKSQSKSAAPHAPAAPYVAPRSMTPERSEVPVVAPVYTRYMWDSVGGPPRVVAGGFLARFRLDDDQLHFILVDAPTGKERWRTPALGTYSDGYRATRAVVAGEHVVFSTFKREVKVVSLATGVEEASHTVADRAEQLCASPDGKQVWLQVTDGKHQLLDLAAGTLKPARHPAWCGPLDYYGRVEDRGRLPKPKVDGLHVYRSYVVGGDGVAFATKSPGTAIPYVVGFDAGTRKVRWQSTLADGDQDKIEPHSGDRDFGALAAGRWFGTYEMTGRGGHQLTAFNVTDGKRLWTTPMPELVGIDRPDALVADERFVYLGRSDQIVILSAETGEILKMVGD
jgi:outer membrane protein assembly factor BamB